MSIDCGHRNRKHSLTQVDRNAYKAVIRCEDCGDELTVETSWALERAEKAETLVKDLRENAKEMAHEYKTTVEALGISRARESAHAKAVKALSEIRDELEAFLDDVELRYIGADWRKLMKKKGWREGE